MILQSREGRSIVMTTHFLDEADVLADVVAVMHQVSRLLFFSLEKEGPV